MTDLSEIFQEIPLLWRIVLVAVAFPIMCYTMWTMHNLLGRWTVCHAQRYCRRMGLTVQRTRWQPEFEPSGMKTEFTLVQLDCLDTGQQRRLVLVSAWLFGVRMLISNEAYPERDDLNWPLAEARRN